MLIHCILLLQCWLKPKWYFPHQSGHKRACYVNLGFCPQRSAWSKMQSELHDHTDWTRQRTCERVRLRRQSMWNTVCVWLGLYPVLDISMPLAGATRSTPFGLIAMETAETDSELWYSLPPAVCFFRHSFNVFKNQLIHWPLTEPSRILFFSWSLSRNLLSLQIHQ